ncbi:hypothetical protein EJ07DRAFT_151647 [Lizonia empirigonia]|nr:hypothetical protein EJ07DRAFT_151647 [Lizonia empirigonia]
MPLKKSQRVKHSSRFHTRPAQRISVLINVAASLCISMDKLKELIRFIPRTATKLCSSADLSVLPTQAKITSGSVAILVDAASALPMEDNIGLMLPALKEVTSLIIGAVERDMSTCSSDSSLAESGSSTTDFAPQNHPGTMGTPPSYSIPFRRTEAEYRGSEIEDTSVVERNPQSSLPQSGKALGFPSLAILPPARLYDDNHEPTRSHVPFTIDEDKSQAHARRALLRNSITTKTMVGSLRPGEAMRRLGSSRMFDSLFSSYVAPRAVPATPNTTSTLATITENNSLSDHDADKKSSRASIGPSAPDVETLPYDRDYDPLDMPLQQDDQGAVSTHFDHEPLLPFESSFSEDDDEKDADISPSCQSPTASLPVLQTGLDNDSQTEATLDDDFANDKAGDCPPNTDWLLSDEDVGDSTELSVSDIAEATQKEAATFSYEMASLTAPVLQDLADIKSSPSLPDNNAAIKPITNTKQKLRNTSSSTASSSNTIQISNGCSWSHTTSDSSTSSAKSTPLAEQAILSQNSPSRCRTHSSPAHPSPSS